MLAKLVKLIKFITITVIGISVCLAVMFLIPFFVMFGIAILIICLIIFGAYVIITDPSGNSR